MNTISKNILFSIFANGINAVISILLVLIVPKFVSLDNYSYWQLFVFYCSFIGFFNIGWVEGIYLKIGGVNYNNLDKIKIRSQLYLFSFYLFLVSFTIVFIVKNFDQTNKTQVIQFAAISLFLTGLRTFMQFILQASSRIKDYSKTLLLDRFIFSILIICTLLLKKYTFESLIICDIIAKIVSLIYTIYLLNDIVFGKIEKIGLIFKEMISNISVGINLLIANIASILTINFIKFLFEISWGVLLFGQIALTISISNLLLVFINAIGIVIFPLLRKLKSNQLNDFYLTTSALITKIGILGIAFYYPLSLFLNQWLPNYSQSVYFMSIIFPIFVFESKVSLIINPYFKALRLERKLLFNNLITLGISGLTSILAILVLENITLGVLCILFSVSIKCFILEKTLQSKLNGLKVYDIYILVVFAAFFVLLNLFISKYAMFIYIIISLIHIGLNFNKIIQDIKKLLSLGEQYEN